MRRWGFAIAIVAVAAAAVAAWLFPRALPIIALEQRITRDAALARADSFFRAHEMDVSNARRAVRFHGADSLRTFVELAGGGHDSLNALVKGRDIAPFVWSVRAFTPREPREARVDFAPDGRVIGFERRLAEADRRPDVGADSARRLAESVVIHWTNDDLARWRFVSSSYETRKRSGRVDRSYVFERVDRRIGGAPLRADVGIAGDVPVRVRTFVEIPESFQRRYAEMRSANELLALIAGLGILAVAGAGLVFVNRAARAGDVRWREPMVVGTVIGVLTLAASLNEIPASWFGYDTATSPRSFQTVMIFGALLNGALIGLLAAMTLATAEVATRRAFPRHLDWWKLWTYRGTREVAARVAGGYAAAAVAFAYVAVFYLATRSLLGWWVPSEMLDDPNQIASPMPWISGVAMSLNAGVWEEALFRALPLSLLSLWVGQRSSRRAWMLAGVIATALLFGFAHSDYESWPPYSRGFEIFLDAVFWAVLFLRFGLLVTVVAHYAYNLVLFGLFAASGSAPEYRISAAMLLVALLAPAIAVAWRWRQQRGLTTAPDDARFGAWQFGEDAPDTATAAPRMTNVLSAHARRVAIMAGVAGLVVAVARPDRPTLGPPYTASRSQVLSIADSMLRAHGGDPAGWKRLSTTASDTLDSWPRFLKDAGLVARAQEFTPFHPPAWWTVRYVHTVGSAAERTEEWRVRVRPDGTPLDARHIIPDSARRDTASADEVRRIAKAALAGALVDTTTLREADYKETARPQRRDVLVTYVDTAVKLPSGAAARAWVGVAGNEPLVTRRGVELPESFLRQDRERQTNRSIIMGLVVLVLLGAIGTGVLLLTRRRSPIVDDGVLDRRSTFVLVGALIVVGIIEQLNGLPSSLFGYDTTQPWARYLGTTALGFVGSIIPPFFALGLWLLLTALRRRVGIPMRNARNEMLLAGLGLGAGIYALLRVEALLPKTGLPPRPTTILDEAVPFLSSALGIPMETLVLVAVTGIPILVLAGITTRWTVRVAILAAGTMLVTGATYAVALAGDVSLVRVVAGVAVLGAVVLAVRAWGAVAGWSWIVAALVFNALGELRLAVHAESAPEQWSGALGVVVALALVLWIRATTAESPPPGSASPSAPLH